MLSILEPYHISESTLCIIRVAVGIALGLLTVYRREMSCNREYQDDDGPNDEVPLNGIDVANRHSDKQGELFCKRGGIRRRKSSSSLPTLNASNETTVETQKHSDPTEELLESAGFLFSGGPFLAVVLAVYDHLILTWFLTSVASVGTLMIRWKRNGVAENHPPQESAEEPCPNPQMSHSVHSVAWNAASDYFTTITSKLDAETNLAPSLDQTLIQKPTRSKSANNISQICEEEYLELIAIARGYLDISILPSETQIAVFSYLHPQDLLNYTCTSKKGVRMLNDDKSSGSELSASENDTATLIWKELFERDYAWILKDWHIGKEALQRSIDLLTLEESQYISPRNSGAVMNHILSIAGGKFNQHEMHYPPIVSMKEFYFTFAESWLNYTIAGCNSTKKCLIGLHGHVFDISNFVTQHPGSTETLLLQAGRNATVFFETMGHSLGARRLALTMCAVINGQCIQWDNGDNRHIVALNTTEEYNSCGLIRPSCPAIQSRKLLPGFLIPRKRSKPRTSIGLMRVRQKLYREEQAELAKADRWGRTVLQRGNLFGGVQVYFDPICSKWRWWYTDLNFDPVYTESVE